MELATIIVDDEPLARKLISRLLKNFPAIKIIGRYATGKEAIKGIDSLKPDILFLDIRLKDMTGFKVLEQIQVTAPLTVFVTAYDQYAIKAFDVFAFDYLLKPFTEERFYKSVNKILEDFANKNSKEGFEKKLPQLKEYLETQNRISSTRIPIPLGNRTAFVNKTDIIYIKAANYHIEIHTKDSKYVLRDSMYNIIRSLNPDQFIRIHRSSIINIGYVEELIGSSFGEVDVKIKEGPRLRISKGYRKEFLIKMGLKK